MPESAALHLPECSSRPVGRAGARLHAETRVFLERNPDTGPRLKYYSRAADVAYWTELWNRHEPVSYDREQRGHFPHQLRGIFNRWLRRSGRVLEAGCGLGQFTVAASAAGYRAEGVDWSAETIDRLRRQFPSIPWHVGDVRRLQFPSCTFDAVYSPGVCEHFEEGPTDVLLETHRVLRPGGVAIVSTPCFNAWLQRHADRVTRDAALNEGDFYQYAFTPDGMSRLLERLGFQVLQVRPYAVLDTFVRCYGWEIPEPWRTPLAFALDYVPYVRQWGSACLWVAQKC